MFKNTAVWVLKVALCFGGLALGSWIGDGIEQKVIGPKRVKIVDVTEINDDDEE